MPHSKHAVPIKLLRKCLSGEHRPAPQASGPSWQALKSKCTCLVVAHQVCHVALITQLCYIYLYPHLWYLHHGRVGQCNNFTPCACNSEASLPQCLKALGTRSCLSAKIGTGSPPHVSAAGRLFRLAPLLLAVDVHAQAMCSLLLVSLQSFGFCNQGLLSSCHLSCVAKPLRVNVSLSSFNLTSM